MQRQIEIKIAEQIKNLVDKQIDRKIRQTDEKD